MLDRIAYGLELELLLRHAAAYAYSHLGNRPDAQDAVQQAALQAWSRIEQYDTTRPFKGWWFAILRNCCFDILRRRRAITSESLDGIDPPDTRTTEVFDWAALEAGLRRLSPAHEEILRLKYYGGLSYDALAEALSIPKGTVMSRLHLARKALAEQLCREAR
jgi:RNA polymerase sigma-70 factor (ECF subfamily)